MRTTIRINDELLEEAKAVALASGKTLAEIVEDSLRETLARRKAMPQRRRVQIRTFQGGGGVKPGVDLSNNAGLLDLMEGIPPGPP